MNKLGRVVALAAAVELLAAAASGQSIATASSHEALLDSMACRSSDIFGGQKNTGAILTVIRGQPTPLRLFKIAPMPGTAPPQVEAVSLAGSEIILERRSNRQGKPDYGRVSWTANDDFVIWLGFDLWWSGKDKIQAGMPPRIEYKHEPYLLPGPDQDHVVPEHGRVARFPQAQAGRYVAEFDPQWPVFRYVPTRGPLSVAGLANQDFAWITDRVFGALSLDLRGRGKALEIYEDEKWKLFSPLWFPKDAKLILFRNGPRDGKPEAIVRLHEKDGVETMSIVKRDSATSELIAVGRFETVFVSPDKTRIYGFKDSSGRFRRIRSESHPSSVAFWLAKFETMSGLEKFYFLENGRYAFVKAEREAGGVGVVILERRDNDIQVAHEFCSTQPAADKVVAQDRSRLFIPRNDGGGNLVVYFHDGPFTGEEKSGDWVIDILSGTGNPILVINYTGNPNRSEPAMRGFAPATASDVDKEVASALKALGSSERKIIFVGSGFGSLVGFAGMNGSNMSPSSFIIVSGVLEPRRVFRTFGRDLTGETMTELGKLARQSVVAPDEKRIAHAMPVLRLHLIHGSKDEQAPYQEVADFVQRFNALTPMRPATLSTIEGMEHSPITRAQYEAVIAAIKNSLPPSR